MYASIEFNARGAACARRWLLPQHELQDVTVRHVRRRGDGLRFLAKAQRAARPPTALGVLEGVRLFLRKHPVRVLDRHALLNKLLQHLGHAALPALAHAREPVQHVLKAVHPPEVHARGDQVL